MNKVAAQSLDWFDSDAENIVEQIHWSCEFPGGCDLKKIQINFQDPDEIR